MSRSMLQELVVFGKTGNESSLRSIIKSATGTTGTTGKASFGNVPSDLASKVVLRIVDVLQSTFLNRKRLMVWVVLILLCDPTKNASAAHFVQKLEGSPILNFAVETCENYPQSECTACLDFLASWTTKDEKRQSLVLKRSRLMMALFRILGLSISAADYRPAIHVLTICSSVVQCTQVSAFVELGGFTALISALEELVKRGLAGYKEKGSMDEEMITPVRKSLWALSDYHCRVSLHLCDAESPSIEKPLFCLSVEDAMNHTLLLNNACDILPDGAERHGTVCNVISAYMYFLDFTIPDGSDAAVALLLFPGPISGLCLLIKSIRVLRSFELCDGIPCADLIINFDKMSTESEAVRAVIELEIGEPLVYCSHPDCNISNLKRGRLKRCVRCMSVWYCGREHQVAHWKEHKQICCAPCAVSTVSAEDCAEPLHVPGSEHNA